MKFVALLLSLWVIGETPCPCLNNRSAPIAATAAASTMLTGPLAVPAGFTTVGREKDPSTGLPRRIKHERTGIELLLVPSTRFGMGSPEGLGALDERPAHVVALNPFWIGVTEVSVAQYRTASPPPDPAAAANLPVTGLTWLEAASWAAAVGLRLTTEAEWEIAARGNSGRRWPWGAERGTPFTTSLKPVGAERRDVSPYGVRGLAGNAWEWCADVYDENYYARSPIENPTGPAPSPAANHVIRGCLPGEEPLNSFGITTRSFGGAGYRSSMLGFRVALTPVRKPQ